MSSIPFSADILIKALITELQKSDCFSLIIIQLKHQISYVTFTTAMSVFRKINK